MGISQFDNFKFQEWKKNFGIINTTCHYHEGAPTLQGIISEWISLCALQFQIFVFDLEAQILSAKLDHFIYDFSILFISIQGIIEFESALKGFFCTKVTRGLEAETFK